MINYFILQLKVWALRLRPPRSPTSNLIYSVQRFSAILRLYIEPAGNCCSQPGAGGVGGGGGTRDCRMILWIEKKSNYDPCVYWITNFTHHKHIENPEYFIKRVCGSRQFWEGGGRTAYYLEKKTSRREVVQTANTM